MLRTTALSAGIAVLLAGCGSPTEPRSDGVLQLRTLAAETVTNHSAQGLRLVIRDGARWAVVWRQVWGEDAPGLPDVDFERDMVVLASAKSSCRAAVTVKAVERGEGLVRVVIAESAESGCYCFVPETTFHAVRTQRVEGNVEFAVQATPPICP